MAISIRRAAALDANHLRGAHDAAQVDHHAADRAHADERDCFAQRHIDQFQPVDGAGQRFGQGRGVEAELGGKRCDRAFFEHQPRQFHVLGEGAGDLVSDGVVDLAVVPHAVAAPVALPAGDVGADGDAIAKLDPRDVSAHLNDRAGRFVPDDRRRLHARVAVAEDADVGTADADRFDLQDRRIVVQFRIVDVLDGDFSKFFENRGFHGGFGFPVENVVPLARCAGEGLGVRAA